MTHTEAVQLFRFLAATYPRRYANLPDVEVETLVGNLAHVFRFELLTDVITAYRDFLSRQKQPPAPSEVLASLKPSAPSGIHKACDPRPWENDPSTYEELVATFGDGEVRRVARECVETGSIEELRWRLDNANRTLH